MFSLRRISSQSVRRAGFSLLLRSMASQIIQVPKMGDSITEGTLIKTVKQLGERVALDEVVCVIETDKVSVDVRAPEAGTLAAYHAALQETVKVGANLFTLSDSPSTVTSTAPTPSTVATVPPKAPVSQSTPIAPVVSFPVSAPATSAIAQKSQSSLRRPAIHFRHGKRENIDAETGLYGSTAGAHAPEDASSYEAELEELFPSKAGAKNFLDLPPMFGRPILTIVESAMITSGGSPYEPPPPPASEKKSKK